MYSLPFGGSVAPDDDERGVKGLRRGKGNRSDTTTAATPSSFPLLYHSYPSPSDFQLPAPCMRSMYAPPRACHRYTQLPHHLTPPQPNTGPPPNPRTLEYSHTPKNDLTNLQARLAKSDSGNLGCRCGAHGFFGFCLDVCVGGVGGERGCVVRGRESRVKEARKSSERLRLAGLSRIDHPPRHRSASADRSQLSEEGHSVGTLEKEET